MNVTVKQLCDLISLSIIAITDDEDNTVIDPNPKGDFHWFSPVCTEVGRILGGNECSIEEAQAINDHIAAIRLGLKLRKNLS